MTIAPSLAPDPAPSDIDPRNHVREMVVGSGSSFGTAMRVLPKARRDAIHAVYAFCRTVDDIADGDASAAEKRALLTSWRGEVDHIYKGTSRSAVGRALAEPIHMFDLPADEFMLMIEGMEMDANGPIVAPDLDTLLTYTRRVAGSVGMLSIRIFGAWRGAPSEAFGLALADALQLTNILRDVEEDAAMGRVYLPWDYLVASGCDSTSPREIARAPGLPEACKQLGGLAAEKFRAARDGIAAHSRFRLFPALMMMGVYEGYLSELAARNWRRERLPVRFSSRQKALRGLGYALLPLPPPRW